MSSQIGLNDKGTHISYGPEQKIGSFIPNRQKTIGKTQMEHPLSANYNNVIEEESICSSQYSCPKIEAVKRNKFPSAELKPKVSP